MKQEDILAIELTGTNLDDCTIAEYLEALLTTLWEEGEGFSSNRPFGNSGWQYDIYKGLVREKVVKGTLDDDGYIEDFDEEAAQQVVLQLIQFVFYGDPSND